MPPIAPTPITATSACIAHSPTECGSNRCIQRPGRGMTSLVPLTLPHRAGQGRPGMQQFGQTEAERSDAAHLEQSSTGPQVHAFPP